MSKNNPENRGKVTELRTWGGKKVKPILYIGGNTKYIAAAFEDGKLAMNNATNQPVAYKDADIAA